MIFSIDLNERIRADPNYPISGFSMLLYKGMVELIFTLLEGVQQV